jgi:hypothetical protein
MEIPRVPMALMPAQPLTHYDDEYEFSNLAGCHHLRASLEISRAGSSNAASARRIFPPPINHESVGSVTLKPSQNNYLTMKK